MTLPPQRWVQPLSVSPGFWKQQLATRILTMPARGDIGALRQVLAEHPDNLNKRGPHNRTLLWEAARRGQQQAVQRLVEQGAEVDATGCNNHESFVQLTPYCAAVYYHRPAVADYLASQGATLDIFRAAFMGDLARGSQVLDVHPELLNAEDPHDLIYHTPLLAFTVAGGQADMMDFLLNHGAIVPLYSAQLLTLAAKDARKDLIDLLLAHGADARVVGADIFVTTPDLQLIKYLLEHGSSATRPLANGFTPLIYLARGEKGEHPEKMRLLLERGAKVDTRGPKGRTALPYAASAGFLKVIALLLEQGADAALVDDAGETALSLAHAAGKMDAAKLLQLPIV